MSSAPPSLADEPRAAAHGALGRDLARAALAVAVCTAICWVMEPHFDPANLIMVYLGGVVVVAVSSRRAASVLAIAGSILVFDWIYVAPRWSFKPTDPQYYFTFAVMLAVGLLIGELAGRGRLQAMVADARTARVQALNALASALASARSPQAVAACVVQAVDAALGVAATLAPADADIPPASTSIPLRAGGEVLGALVLQRPAGQWHAEQRELLDGFANQAALALERSLLEARSAAAAIAAETERLRNTLLSSISHDFRTPLTTIVGAATTLLDQEAALDPQRRRDLLRGVLSQAERLHLLSSSLLDLTRLEAGAIQPRCEWCPADELVEEVVRAMGVRLAQHRVEVDVSGEAVVWCDAALVEQVLANLLENAVRHTPAGGRVAIAVDVEAEPGWWRLAVTDSGPGIPAGEEQRVFEKFHRTSATSRDGTGLRLAICAAIARLHGGTIAARNVPGASFTMRLPQPKLPSVGMETT